MSESGLPCAVPQVGAWSVRERAPGGLPIELTDAYPKFKAAINVLPGTDPNWEEVIQRAAQLLALHSKDLSVASELGVALWMERRFAGLQDAVAIWLDLLSEPIWPHVWPRARAERVTQLQRFLARVDGSLRDPAQRNMRQGERAAQESVVEALRLLESEASRQMEGASCTDDIRKLRRAIVDIAGTSAPKLPAPTATGPSAEQIASQLVSARDQLAEVLTGPASLDVVDPWWTAVRRPLWQVLRAAVGAWPEMPAAWRLARALAWSLETPPQGARGLIAMDLRVAQDLASAIGRLTQSGGTASWFDLEALWQERGHIHWLDPHRVAVERLRRSGLEGSALAVERSVASWLDRARGIADLRCDDEPRTRLADDLTRKWAARLPSPSAHERTQPPVAAPTYSAVVLTNCAEKLQKEIRGTLAPSGGPPGGNPLDILAALTTLRAPTEALVQLLAALDPMSPITANLALAWPALMGAAPTLARGEPVPGSAPLDPPAEDLVWEVEQVDRSPLQRVEALWPAIAAHPWWLDLYRSLSEALTLAGGQAAAAVVADCAEELVLAWPALIEASFVGGKSVADSATRTWLAGHRVQREAARQTTPVEAPPRAPASSAATSETPSSREARAQPALTSDEMEDPWTSGLQQIVSGQVREGLLALEEVAQSAPGGRQRFVGSLRIAQALIEAGERTSADALLTALDEVAARQDLDRWEPSLAQAVTRARWRLQLEVNDVPEATTKANTSSTLLVRAASQGLFGLLAPPDQS